MPRSPRTNPLPLLISLLLFLLAALPAAAAGAERYGIAVKPTPVLNTADFRAVFGGLSGKTIRKDRCGQIRNLEFVALPGTVFRIEDESLNGRQKIYRVTTTDYPYGTNKGYFIDARTVRLENSAPPARLAILPDREKIIANLKKRVGTRYVWGGNVAEGVPEFAAWYMPAGAPDKEIWQLAGLDCSGLLYEATGGYTPRNTSSLLDYGKTVPVAGKSAEEITGLLQPLDLIVWPGHVMIVIDEGKIIESSLLCSKPEDGVRTGTVAATLATLTNRRKPADTIVNGSREFLVRRWYPADRITAP